MNILFVSLEESGKKISNTILREISKKSSQHNYFTFGLDGNFSNKIKEIKNTKIIPLMGFMEVLKNILYIFNLRNILIKRVKKFNIDHIFFIDSFDFSRFFYKKFNIIKCSQIVGPSVFIWKKNKANFINNNFEKLFSIFIDEKKYYKTNKFSFIGHPLSSDIIIRKTKFNDIKNIGIFLGSRDQEVINNLEIISTFVNSSHLKFNFFFFTLTKYKKFIKKEFLNNHNVKILLNDKNYYSNISKLDFALACSGTVHLELSLSKIPHLIFYRTNIINALIFKLFINIKFISLLNIFSNKEIVKEFIQNDFNSSSIHSYVNFINHKHKLNKLSQELSLSVNKNNINYFNVSPIIDYLKMFS